MKKPAHRADPLEYEAEILPGLKPFALAEMRRRLGDTVLVIEDGEPDEIRFRFTGRLSDVHALRTVVAVYHVLSYAIPRPRALLGHQNLTRLIDSIERVRAMHPPGAFRTLRFSAAGRDSSVFQRLAGEVAEQTGLAPADDDADLLLRVRPARAPGSGWEVLIRTTPRPLATRDWRVRDMPGALNATIAAALVELTRPAGSDRFLNPMCGSGTLLIERAARGPAAVIGGCDTSPTALLHARENIAASGFAGSIDVFEMDATRLEFPDGTLDAICADLPWGQLSGARHTNPTLYRNALTEWARVAAPGARLALITHEVRLFESLLPEIASRWSLEVAIRVFQGGLHPRMYVLERTGRR